MDNKKQGYKIYLTAADYNRLKTKAAEVGFAGKGSVSHLINKLANEPTIFLDSNVKTIMAAFNLREVKGGKD